MEWWKNAEAVHLLSSHSLHQDNVPGSFSLLHNKKQSKQECAEVQKCVGEAVWTCCPWRSPSWVLWLEMLLSSTIKPQGCVTLTILLLLLQRSRLFSLLREGLGWFLRVCRWRDSAPDHVLHFVLTKIEVQRMDAVAQCSLNP